MPNPALKPPKSLLRQVGRAIADYRMIRAGDRLLLGVSGGKDSLSLLHILRHLQTYAPVRFELAVLTVDPLVPGFDPSHLPQCYPGLTWHYERQPLIAQARTHMDGDSFCAYCARMKRGIMYRVCREQGYNCLALGQHLDDLAESLLMSIFHNGQLRTMKAHYVNKAGDLRIIRPLAYCRERQTADFARAAALPVVADSCPACFALPTRREHTKALLAREEAGHPQLFANLLHAMRPLLTEGPVPGEGTAVPEQTRARPDLAALAAALIPLARRYAWRLVVLFGSVARDGQGRDLDLAVLPRVQPELLEQGRWWSDLGALVPGIALDLLVLGPATSPLTRFEVMREGRCLFEDTVGLFDREQDRAFFLYADTQWIRDRMRETGHDRGQA